MATDQRNLPAFFNTNADFETWCQGIHAQLVAAGWTNTADTGQINNVTVAKPGGTNTSQGYEIWRNSTSDIYFKIEYGSGAIATTPGIWLTPGTGSNGAGTITGPGSNTLNRGQFASNFQSQVAGGTLPSYCSGDGTYLAILSNNDPGTTGSNPQSIWGFFIDKIRDATGAVTGEGFVVVAWSGGSSAVNYWSVVGNTPYANNNSNQFTLFVGPTSGQSTSWSVGFTARQYGGNELVMPLMVAAGQIRFLKCGVIYSALDFGTANATTFTATNFGATHTYLALPIINGYGQQILNWRGMCPSIWDSFAMLWE